MKLMVKNLPAEPQEQALHELFAKHGECTVTLKKVTDIQDCTADVTYRDEETGKTALRELNDHQFGGNQIAVEEVADLAPCVPSTPPKSPSHSHSRSRSHSPVAAPPSAPIPSDLSTPAKINSTSPTKPTDPSSEKSEGEQVVEEEKNDGDKVGEVEKGKKKKQGEKQDFAVEEDGSKFKILSTNKRNDELSSWKCLACNRKIQKKSVKAHIASKTHKQHIS